MSDHVFDSVAGADRDYSVSTDAMRWSPPRLPEPDPDQLTQEPAEAA